MRLPEVAPVLMAMLCCVVGEGGVELGESRDEQGRWCWVFGEGSRS